LRAFGSQARQYSVLHCSLRRSPDRYDGERQSRLTAQLVELAIDDQHAYG
jgi:hypothetical protein